MFSIRDNFTQAKYINEDKKTGKAFYRWYATIEAGMVALGINLPVLL